MRKKVLILEDMETTRTALKRIVESCDDAITAYAFSEAVSYTHLTLPTTPYV